MARPACVTDKVSRGRSEKMARQQMSRDGKTKQLKIATIGDFKRLGRIDDGEVSRPADLLVTTLRVAAHPFELKINEAQIVHAARDVRTQAQNPVLGCGDAGNPDRTSVSPGYRPLERMLGFFARLQLDESVREIVSPTTKGLIRLTLFCRPLHGRPNK
jgi:hypothetical protein